MSDCRHNAPNREPEAGDVQSQRQQLDEPTREQLVDRLVDCLFSFEGEADLEALDRCLEDLDKAGAVLEDFDVEQGLKDFHERFGDAFESEPQKSEKNVRSRRPLARIAIIAAALCAFVFTAQATGLDIFGAIARWTSEQFSFVREGEMRGPKDSLEYASLQVALDDLNVVEKLSPTKFPEGTELSDIQVRKQKDGIAISATYSLAEELFFISLRKVATAPHGQIEIENSDVEIYGSGGIEHHLMSDVKQRKVTWYNGAWECYIAGDLSRNDLLMMIDSIYE